MSSSALTFDATLPKGKRVTVTLDTRGVSLAKLHIPWSNIRMIEVLEPGEVCLTTIASTGDHVKVILTDARTLVTDDTLAALAQYNVL